MSTFLLIHLESVVLKCHIFITIGLHLFPLIYLFLFPGQVKQRFKRYSQNGLRNLRTSESLLLWILHPKANNTWTSYKHCSTSNLLVDIIPTAVISFIPPLWTGSTSDKEIVNNSGLVNCLDQCNEVMADKGFLIHYLLTFKKIQLISPAYYQGPRLCTNAVTDNHCVVVSWAVCTEVKELMHFIRCYSVTFENYARSQCVYLCCTIKPCQTSMK